MNFYDQKIESTIDSTYIKINKSSFDLESNHLAPKQEGKFYKFIKSIDLLLGYESEEDIKNHIMSTCENYVDELKSILKDELHSLSSKLHQIIPCPKVQFSEQSDAVDLTYDIEYPDFKFGANFKKNLFKILDLEGKSEVITSPLMILLTGHEIKFSGDLVKLGYATLNAKNFQNKVDAVQETLLKKIRKQFLENSKKELNHIKKTYHKAIENYYHEMIEVIYSEHLKMLHPDNVWNISCHLYDSLNHWNRDMDCPDYVEGKLDDRLIYLIAGRISSVLSDFSDVPQRVMAYRIWETLNARND